MNFIFPVGVLQQSESDQIDDESLPEDFQPGSEDIIKYATKKLLLPVITGFLSAIINDLSCLIICRYNLPA